MKYRFMILPLLLIIVLLGACGQKSNTQLNGKQIIYSSEENKETFGNWIPTFYYFDNKDTNEAIVRIKFLYKPDTSVFINYYVYRITNSSIMSKWNSMCMNSSESCKGREFKTDKYYIISWPLSGEKNCTNYDLCNVLMENFSNILKRDKEDSIDEIISDLN